MPSRAATILRVLRDGRAASTLSVAEWNAVLPLLRGHGLSARLAGDLAARGGLGDVPGAVAVHLAAARAVADSYGVKVRSELRFLNMALEKSGLHAVLLKGAAYVAADLDAGRGRLFGDVDILVPESDLAATETCLDGSGWRTKRLSSYDETYYRLWTHQVPPRVHQTRGSVVDLHHAIVPRTSRLRFPAAPVIAAATPMPDLPGLAVPAPHHLFLHSVVHLFGEEETGMGLRDLSDLDRLARQFGSDPGFWRQLLDFADLHGLRGPISYAFTLLRQFFATPIPDDVIDGTAGVGPAGAVTRFLFRRAILPSDRAYLQSKLARTMLFIRGHYLKMPWHILVPHVVRKAFMRAEVPE